MSETNKRINPEQESLEDTVDSEIEYADPVELSPIGDEELFATEIKMMVVDDAPRVFALCEEIGDRVDATTIAWGMDFNDRVEVVSAADDGVSGVFGSAERARWLFSAHDKIKVRLVWVHDTVSSQAA